MAKDEVLPVRIDPELKAVFLRVAEMEDRPASQIIRELIREYVKSHAQLDLIEGKGRSKK
jgi:predicted transcriptional regulator